MKKLLRQFVFAACIVVLAFGLASCVAKAPAKTSPSASSPSTYSSTSPSADSSAASSSSAPVSSSQPSSSGLEIAADDGSYAQSHLTGGEYVPPDITVKKNGTYTDKDHVALYIHIYGTVPQNYVSKNKARKAGWVNTEGNLWDVLPDKSIGGGSFYNDDHMMPDAPDREWFECDIDYAGGYRNAKRIVYSNDGLIYYTGDHYKTFQRLY